jgi:hypothetical protein
MFVRAVDVIVLWLAADSGWRYARLRRSEGGRFFGSVRAPDLLFVLFVVSIPVAIELGQPLGDQVAFAWLPVATALAAGMVASERRRTAVRSNA